ncbi:Sec-independent protein translocase subunit TatA [Streptomyces sclerotialus]|uniref:Sec-independent protein translocase subunit TatA n=1 Tax=Streptomyces sclerotialus TaxID=1957 RepID=UPI000568362C
MFGLSELALILIVVIVVFGAKKLPELARSAGKSARILKSEARAMKDEEKAAETAPPQVVTGTIVERADRGHTDHERREGPTASA